LTEARHKEFARELTKHPFFEKGRIIVSNKSKKSFTIATIGRKLNTGTFETKLEPYPASITPGALADKLIVPLKDKRDIIVIAQNDDGRLLIGRAHEPGWEPKMVTETKNEQTSVRVAKIAAKGVTHPQSLTDEEIRSVCASALSQTPDHIKKEAGVDQ
jgi:hypothetical protein